MAQTSNQRIIVILSALLLAAVAVASAIYVFLPSPEVPLKEPDLSTVFDTSVTQQPAYTNLDTNALREGALPVAPPQVAGKANPFL